jgi:hypothetical protein
MFLRKSHLFLNFFESLQNKCFSSIKPKGAEFFPLENHLWRTFAENSFLMTFM